MPHRIRTGKIQTNGKQKLAPQETLDLIQASLDDDKAQDLMVIDLEGKTSMADYLVIASGTSSRQVAAMATHLQEKLKDAGQGKVATEGTSMGDWVLLDAGDVIVHLFRPEVRAFYNIEAMWGHEGPAAPALDMPL
jgi:ribosome-associated protein